MQLAQALHEAGDAVGGDRDARARREALPEAGGEANPNALIALIATERGDTARAIQALEAVVKVDHTDVESARKLAALLEKQGDAARTAAAYEIVAELDPFDAQAQGHVGRFALKNGNTDRAIRAFRAALASNPADRAGAHIDLAEASFTAGQVDDAKRQALAALEIAPSFERAQDLLLKIVDAQPGARGGAPMKRHAAPRADRRARGAAARRTGAPVAGDRAGAALQDDRFAGLQWTFVRIRYYAFTVDSRYRVDYWGEPWAIDAPAAEQNLSRRLRTATAIEVKRSDRPHARRSRSCGTRAGSTSSSRATCGCATTRCRSCASSCCAAAR